VNCPNCSTSNLDTASICANCGRPLTAPPAHTPSQSPSQSYVPPPPPPPAYPQGSYSGAPAAAVPNYLVPSILVTLCCCLPFGIVAIVYAAQVNSKLAAGDVAGAMAASRSAKMWCIIAALTGVIVSVLWIVLAGGSAVLEGFREGMANR
jgi:hypothetical protein